MHTIRAVISVVLFACTGLAGAGEQSLAGNWVLAVGEDPDTYATVASLRQDSSTSIKDEYATKDVVPRLAFRCAPGDPTVTARIDWGRFISSFNTELGFPVAEGTRLWLKWGVDRSEKVTISPSGEDTEKLIEQIKDGARLEVEISPYSEGPVNAHYDLAGFAEAMATLLKNCD